MKATVTFEVTKDKTIVISTNTIGETDTFDITGTVAEGKLIDLLKELREHQTEKQILEAINIDNWKEV